MDTDDLELDDDFLLPHQAPSRIRAATQPVVPPCPRPAVQHSSTLTRLNTTLDVQKSIPGPAGLSSRARRPQPPRGVNSAGLGSVGPNSAVIDSCVVCLEECLPLLAGGGYSVKLKVRQQVLVFMCYELTSLFFGRIMSCMKRHMLCRKAGSFCATC